MSWNKNSAKVIGITAAAAMALSLAPATAFTAYAAPRNGSSVSEQAVSSATAFSDGQVTSASVNGKAATVKDGSVSAEFTGNSLKVIPGVVTLADGSTISFQQTATNTLLGSDGAVYSLYNASQTNAGNQTVTLHRNSNSSAGITPADLHFTFTVTPTDLAGVTAADLTYNTKDQKADVKFVKNGVTLQENQDYRVQFFNKAGQNSADAVHEVKKAGTYYAALTGIGNYGSGNNRVTEVSFKVNPLDLAKATVEQSDRADNITPSINDIQVDNVSGSDLRTAGDAELVGQDPTFINNGAHKYVLQAKQPATGNVTGTATLTFNRVDKVVSSSNFRYDGNPWTSGITLRLDKTTPDKFDESKITNNLTSPTLTPSEYTVSYEKKQGSNWVTSSLSELNSTAGDYRVEVIVDPSKTNYQLGGNSGYLNVAVRHNAGAHVYVTINGKLQGNDRPANNAHAEYNGKVIPVTVKVLSNFDGHAALIKGKDYSVKIQTIIAGETPQDVGQIINRGKYAITVTALGGLSFQNDAYPASNPLHNSTTDVTRFTVDPMQVSLRNLPNSFSNALAYKVDTYDAGKNFAYANGNAIVPQPVFVKNGTQDIVSVPSSAYTISFTKDGQAAVFAEQGKYTLHLSNADPDGNYLVTNANIQVQITNDRYFEDVPADSYYSKFIYDLASKGIMTGIGKTDLFGFHWAYTRGQAITVLYRLARSRALPDGNKVASTANEVATQFENKHNTVKMPFDDVDPNTFYSAPVVWGKQVGLITGYAGTKNFEPNKSVSAEELATMLDRYAKQVDPDYKAGDESVLSNYTDASKVSAFARSHVAWAVTNKMMGQGTKQLDPQNSIERWRVATIISRSGLADNNKPLAR